MSAGRRIGLVVVVKDEVYDIAGWLAWHLAIGFDTILVIDDCSTDGTDQVVAAAAGSADVRYLKAVQDHSFFYERQQREYRRAIRDLKDDFSWLCFLDADEYLLLLEDQNISSFLARFPQADGVAVNWCLHGNNDHVRRPLVPAPAAYPRRSGADQAINRHVKSIVRPDRVGDGWANVHWFDVRPDRYVNVRGETVRWSDTVGIINGTPCFDVARVMHFQNRSMEHFIERARKRPDIPVSGRSWSDELWQTEEDRTPPSFLAPMFGTLALIELATSNLLLRIMIKSLRRPNSGGILPGQSFDRTRPPISIFSIGTYHDTRLQVDPSTNLIVHAAEGVVGLLPLFLVRSPALPSDALLVAAMKEDRPLRLIGGRQAATVIRLEIADASEGRVTLRLPETSRFLVAEPTDIGGGAKRIVADRREIRDWEMFSLHEAVASASHPSIMPLAEAYVSAVRESVTVGRLEDWLVAYDPHVTTRLLQTMLRRMPEIEGLRLAARLVGVLPAELLSGSQYS